MAADAKRKGFSLFALLAILGGLAFTFSALLWESHLEHGPIESPAQLVFEASPEPGSPLQGTLTIDQQSRPDLGSTAATFLEKIGITLLIFGIVDLLFHLPALSDHFLQQLRELVVTDSYVKKLSKPSLDELIDRALVAKLEDPSIAADGRFLEYFRSDLQPFISQPYREKAEAQIFCLGTEGDAFVIRDVCTYTCRSSGGNIQDCVRWQNDPAEFSGLREATISLRRPGPGGGAEQVIATIHSFKYKYSGSDELYDKPLPDKKPECHVISAPLASYLQDDGLVVKIEANYLVRRGVFQYLQM